MIIILVFILLGLKIIMKMGTEGELSASDVNMQLKLIEDYAVMKIKEPFVWAMKMYMSVVPYEKKMCGLTDDRIKDYMLRALELSVT